MSDKFVDEKRETSIGFMSGEYAGKKMTLAPTASTTSRIASGL